MSFGMMEGAFFVGRTELLTWINTFLQLPYTKIEQCASGAAACQIMDAIYPGKVALGKVNFNARLEYEFVNNYKVLQSAFQKAGVDKAIPVERLVKAKYQDNLEFIQWLKKFFDINYNSSSNYDAVARRQECGCAALITDKTESAPASGLGSTTSAAGTTKTTTRTKPTTTVVPPKEQHAAATTEAPPSSAAAGATTGPASRTRAQSSAPAMTRSATVGASSSSATTAAVAGPADPTKAKTADMIDRRQSMAAPGNRSNVLRNGSNDPASRRASILKQIPTDDRVKELTRQVAELKVLLDTAEKERDFYFKKLLDIEELVEMHKDFPANMPDLILGVIDPNYNGSENKEQLATISS